AGQTGERHTFETGTAEIEASLCATIAFVYPLMNVFQSNAASIPAHRLPSFSVSALRLSLQEEGTTYGPSRRPFPVKTVSHGFDVASAESPLPVTTTIFPLGSISYRATSIPAFFACRAILRSVGLRGPRFSSSVIAMQSKRHGSRCAARPRRRHR